MRQVDARDLPEHAIATFEAATGLAVCCHDLGQLLWRFLEPRHLQHTLGLCRLVKRHRQAACDHCCVERVRSALAGAPHGLVKRCHAGLVEWVAPVHDDAGGLWAVLFAGARSAGPGLHIDVDGPPGPAGPWRRPALALPPLGEDQAGHVLELLRQLAARLDRWRREDLPRLASPARAGRSRCETIRIWIQQHHASGLGLPDLAAHLGLSPDRTRHVVKACRGLGFVDLLNAERLRTAADLLRRTALPVRAVADASGFRNRAHFHQVFRRGLGCTPGQWRRSGAS
jgi:AraC-like DNA-binding protein